MNFINIEVLCNTVVESEWNMIWKPLYSFELSLGTTLCIYKAYEVVGSQRMGEWDEYKIRNLTPNYITLTVVE